MADNTAMCAQCGAMFVLTTSGRPRVYCSSPECRRARDRVRKRIRGGDRICVVCSKGFKRQTSNVTCGSPACTDKYRSEQDRLRASRDRDRRREKARDRKPVSRSCVICETAFGARTNKKTCSPECAKTRNDRLSSKYRTRPEVMERARARWADPEYRQRQLDRNKKRWADPELRPHLTAQRQRIMKRYRSKPEIQEKQRQENRSRVRRQVQRLRDRDGDRCRLCKRKINFELAWPHPMSKSIDHVIPVSRGGTDDLVNLQLAHVRCNISKGNRGLGPEQLRFV